MNLVNKIFSGTMLFLLIFCLSTVALAKPISQESVVCEQEIVVQADDWLSKIADKAYGNVFAYPAIVQANNIKNSADETFAKIDNPDHIEIGWKLCLPHPNDVESLLEHSTEVQNVPVPSIKPTNLEVGSLILATTTSTDNSGLLEVILPDFEIRYGAAVEVIAVGTGQAIQLGQNGDADVLLVHARIYEDAFIDAGFGVNRQDVMYNDFVIIGPSTDPAGIRGMTDVVAALAQIAQTERTFISRGDDSGTHIKEQGLWQISNWPLVESNGFKTTGKTYVRPHGDWYLSVGQGMGATLTMAHEQQAYTLSDRATFLARTLKGIDLEILVEGDSRLFNPYGVIAVNPEKHPKVNALGATVFIEWLTSLETQQRIGQFGIDAFGMPLFVPDSAAWNTAKQ